MDPSAVKHAEHEDWKVCEDLKLGTARSWINEGVVRQQLRYTVWDKVGDSTEDRRNGKMLHPSQEGKLALELN